MKRILVILAVVMVVSLLGAAATAFAGNGAPSGAHYNLNIIGVPQTKTADMSGDNGHRIFVSLGSKTGAPTTSIIWLCQSGVGTACLDVPADGFQVIDANGTDKDGAMFALPNPDVNNTGTTTYSVFARALGTPGGSAKMSTCAYDPTLGYDVCSVATLTLTRDKNPSKFTNVSKELLYIYYDINGDTVMERVPLFGDELQDYFWQYDNNGLKLAQLRFYDCSTTVPGATDPFGELIASTCAVK